MVKEFTDFPNVGAIQVGDKLVGTRDNVNIQVDFDSGIKDSSGHYLFGYESSSVLAENYLKFKNAISGSPAVGTSDGADTNVSMLFSPKGEGDFMTETAGAGSFKHVSGGTGGFEVTTGGFLNFNATQGFTGVSNDATLENASPRMLITEYAAKSYIDTNAAPADATYITNTNQTADLPNSLQLLGTSNQIVATNGTLSLPSTLIAPGTFRATTSINIAGAGATITSFSIDGTLAGNSDELSPTQKAVKTYADTADTAIKSYSYITKTDNTANLPGSTPLSSLSSGFLSNTTATGVLHPRTMTGTTNQIDIANGDGVSGNPIYALSSTLVTPGTVTLGGDLNVATHKIVSNSGTPIQLIPNNDSDGIDLSSSIVRIDTDLRHAGEPDNKITFATAAQTYYIGGTSIFDINASGFRLGMGSRISSISNSPSASSASEGMTAESIQIAIANQIGSAKSFRGGYNASTNLFPATGGSGVAGAVLAGDVWVITTGGTLGGTAVSQGDTIIALVDIPGQTAGNWSVNANGVATFGPIGNSRGGVVRPEDNDYPFNYITGLPDTAANGKIMQGTGTAWQEAVLASSTGISINNVSGTITFTNSAPDQTVAITNSNGLSIGGTYPSFTIGLSAPVSPPNGGTGFSAYAKGDLIHASSTDVLSKLGIGSTGDVLTVASGDMVWAAPVVSSVFGRATGAIVAASGDYNESQIDPSFNPVTTSTATLNPGQNYYDTYSGLCVMTLNATFPAGKRVRVRAGPTGATFKIAQNSGQLIRYGAQNGVSVVTTTGTGGYLQSVDPNTTVDIECMVANTEFAVVSNVNNLTVN